jgi:hypothetical protein
VATPFTSDALVEQVRDITSLPDAHWLTTAKLLEIADSEVLVTARVKMQRGEQFLTSQDVALSPSTLRYRLPRRALGRAVHSIALVGANGGVTPLTEIDAADASGVFGFGVTSSGDYYIEDDFIVFPVAPTSGSSLRVRYLRRLSRLVPLASAVLIRSAVSSTSFEIPPDVSTVIPASSYVDIVRGDSPFDVMYADRLLTEQSSGAIDLDPTTPVVPSDFVDLTAIANDRQDYVCLRDETVYPQLPSEMHPALVSAVAQRVLEALGDQPGTARAEATLRARMQAATDLMAPRNQDRSRAIVNRFSALRGGGSRRGPCR